LLNSFLEALREGREMWEANVTCPAGGGCGVSSLEVVEGWLCPVCVAPVDVEVSRVTMTAINRGRGVVEEGMLFSLDVVNPGQVFSFTVLTSSEEFSRYIRELEGGEVRVGGAKSRGFGVATVERVSIEGLDAWLSREAAKVRGTDFFCLECLSPAFKLTLENGLRSKIPAGEVVEEAARNYEETVGRRVSVKGVRYVCLQGGVTSVSGWSLKYDQRRPVIPALSPGSTLYFRVENLAEVVEPLLLLEVKGVGGFSHMGFGRFKLWIGGE